MTEPDAPSPDESPEDEDEPKTVLEVLGDQTQVVSRVQLQEVKEEDSPVHKPLDADSKDVPRRMGRYQIAGEIARGGMGAIYKARDVDLGRDIALKVLIEDFAERPEMLQRFMEEAQIGGQLQHPGIVPVHEMGLVGGKTPYFAMKLVKGETLSRLLDDRESPAADRQRFLGIFEQVCQTLAYAHARGVIHRDLKPSNIMVGAFGEVQVMDWGLAKVLARGGTADDRRPVTKRPEVSVIETVRSGSTASDSLAGSVLGTPAYMAPEQARGELDRVGERSDVFGLGAILCQILSGKPPYVGDSTREIHRAAKEGDLDGARERLEECGGDRDLVDLALGCLAFEPRERPRDAGRVANEVRRYRESLEARAKSLEIEAAEASVRAQAERKARGLTMGLAAAVVLTVVTGAGAYLFVERERQAAVEVATTRYHEAMAEASAFRAQAVALGTVDPAPWNAARAAAGRAESIAREQDAAPRLLADAEALVHEVDEEYRRRRFLARLEDIFATTAFQTTATIARAYASAFRGFLGRDLLEMSPEEAVTQLRQLDDIETLALALHTWATYAFRVGDGAAALYEIVDAIDPDLWRRRMRRISRTGGREEVRALVDDALRGTRAEADYRVLVELLGRFRDPVIVPVIQRMIELYPRSWWAQVAMGNMIMGMDPNRKAEALRYLYAAATLAGSSRFAWSDLGSQLEGAGEPHSALDVYLRGLKVSPGHQLFHDRVLKLLTETRPENLGSSLGHCIDFYERLLASNRSVGVRAHLVLGLARSLDHQLREELHEAVRALESIDWDFSYPTLYADLLEALRGRLLPDLVSYASIDATFDSTKPLVPRHARWRYFPGRREPSEGLAWTLPGFDDGDWAEGEAGFGYDDGDDRTVLGDMNGQYTTVYIRHVFARADPEQIVVLRLAVRVDDGFVAYLNGEEVARFGVEAPGPPPFDATASTTLDDARNFEIDIARDALRAGSNILAIHGLNSGLTSSDLTLDPSLVAEVSPSAAMARGRARLESFRRVERTEDAGPRIKYSEGRLLQLEGRTEDATEAFRQVTRGDPDAFEPVLRLGECLLKGSPTAANVNELRRSLSSNDRRHAPIWNRWLAASLATLRRSPTELLGLLPPPRSSGQREPNSAPDARLSYPDELRSLLELLAAGKALRINCGDQQYEGADGRLWLGDRFFHGGDLSDARSAAWLPTEFEDTDDDPLYAEGRFFTNLYRPGGGYRIPLPPGRYRVALHFAESYFTVTGARVFDVLVEGETKLEAYDCVKEVGFTRADVRSFEVDVEDGLLEISFRWRANNPRMAALEVTPVR